MLHLREVLIVEGKYDAITLANIVDCPIFATNGFRIFKDEKRMQMLRSMAKERGVIVLTDSDGAGVIIRRYLSGALPNISIKQAYIPQITGKEKRKKNPSKEGFLGVEGMKEDTIKNALMAAGACLNEGAEEKSKWLTKSRFFEDGFSGMPNSVEKRKELLKYFDLPLNLSTGRLIEWLNVAVDETEYMSVLEKLKCNR